MAFVLTSMGSCLATTAVSMLASCGFQACRCAAGEVVKTSARLAYSTLFFSSMVLAWVLRDYAKPLVEKIPWIMRGVIEPGDQWFGQQAVHRVSLGTFIFFAGLSAALYGVKSRDDKRDQFLQHGGWAIKGILWLVCNFIPFFMPNSVVKAYGYLARGGSAIFIFIQILLLIDCLYAWNDSWVNNEDDRYMYGLLTMTVVAYSGCIALAAVMFTFFNAASGCTFNITAISLSMVLAAAFGSLSLHPKVKSGSLFPASIISLYCMYLCYSAMASEPRSYECNALGHRMSAATQSTLAMGVVFTVLSIVYSAWRVGSSQSLLSFERPPGAAAAAPAVASGADVEAARPRPKPKQPLDRLSALSESDVAGAKPLLADVHPPHDEEGMQRTAGAAAGSNAAPLTAAAEDDAEEEEIANPVTYSYSFFHGIFALAAMYLAMLMTGWSQGAGEDKDLIDVGWASVAVKLTTEAVCGLLYVWTLVAPLVLPDREF